MAYNAQNPNGQSTKANSAPVTVASDQTLYAAVTSPNGAAAGLFATVSAYGYARVTTEPGGLFGDGFDGVTIDTTNRWNTPIGTVTQTGGALTVGNATVSTTHKLFSMPSFPPNGLNFTVLGFVATLEATPLVTNVARFFGFGTHTGSPSAAVPVTDGIGFEFDGAGKLWAAIYVNSVRTSSVDISASAIAGPTRYGVLVRSDLAIFYIGSTEIPVASISFVTPATQTLPVMFQQINGGTVTGSPSTKIAAAAVHDTGHNSNQISDGTYAWRKASVSAAGALATRQVNSDGTISSGVQPYGSAKTSPEPTTSFFDPFDAALDTTNRWIAAGTAAPTISAGLLNFNTSTTAGATSFLTSIPSFVPMVPAFSQNSWLIQLDPAGAATTQAYRFFGMGISPGSPTQAAPLTDAFGFCVDTTGKMYFDVWASGSRVSRTDLSSTGLNIQPLDGLYHRYLVQIRTDRIYVFLDSVDAPVLSLSLIGPNVQTLPIKAMQINGITQSTAPVMKVQGVAVADMGRNSASISDPTYPWRRASVSAGGALSITKLDTVTSGTITTQNLVPAGTATANSAVEIDTTGKGTVTFQVEGTYTGALTVQARVNPTGAWVTVNSATTLINISTGAYSATVPSATQNIYQTDCGGFAAVRVTALAAVTGTATISIRAFDAVALNALDTPLPPGTNSIGAVTLTSTTITGSPTVINTPVTPTVLYVNSTATTNGQNMKASAGTLWSMACSNAGAAAAFVKIYNITTAPTVGTTVPALTIAIPAGSTTVVSGGANGIRLTSGLAIAITNLVADTDTTAVAAAQVKVVASFT